MAKNTLYCSQCGKGNIIDNSLGLSQFLCISCNAVNQIKSAEAETGGKRRLKEVYEKSQQSSDDSKQKMANFRRKKTLVDKNIELLERIESMEHEALEMKNDYLELSKEMASQSSSAVVTGVDESFKEDLMIQFNGLIDTVKEVQDAVSTLHKSSSANQVEFPDIQENISTALKEINFPNIDVGFIQQEFKNIQHVLNTIAGDARSAKQEVAELKSVVKGLESKLANGSMVASSSSSSSMGELSGVEIPKTTQILTAEPIPAMREESSSSITMKPTKGSKKFKAMSEKLKNLKL